MKPWILLALVLVPLAFGLQVDVQTAPQNVTTTSTVSCLVTATGTGTLTADIQWYRNGAPYGSDTETIALASGVQNSTGSAGSLEASDTTKDDTWICQASVDNGTLVNASNSTAFTVGNSQPLVSFPITRQIATEDSAFAITATASDPDLDPIVTWISSDLNQSYYGGELFTIDTNGQISFTPTAAHVGNHTIALLASDGELFGGRNVIFEVLEVNDRPVIDPIADQNATEGEQWWTLVTASDEEGDPITFLNSSDLGSLQMQAVDATTVNISLMPQYSQRGNHTITIIAHETGNASHNTTASFILTVQTNNRLPVIDTISDPGGTQGGFYTLVMNATDQDPTDELNFSITTSCPLPNPWTVTMLSTDPANATGEAQTILTNDHIVCRDITVIVRDYDNGEERDNDTQALTLNLINVNDAPTIHQTSNDPQNRPTQQDISSLYAPTDLEFVYQVNATDPDSLTYEGEVLTYSDDTSLFDIDANGEIRFTPSQAQIGNHLINITVTDDQGLSGSRLMNLTIELNRAPNITTTPNATCYEDLACIVNLTAQDLDAGDNLTFTATLVNASIASNTSPTTNHTIAWQGLTRSEFQRVHANLQVGNYTYNVTVTDRYGATDSQLLMLVVENTNDAPVFANTIPFPDPVVETHLASFLVDASDDDFANTAENLTLSVSISGPNTSLFSPVKLSNTQWRISFTPNASDVGNYSVNLTLQDLLGSQAQQTINFTVWDQSSPPVIQMVRPALNSTSGITTPAWVNATPLGGSTAVTLLEGVPYTFNATYQDPDTASGDITVTWTDETGATVQQTSGNQDHGLVHNFGYFGSGSHSFTVNVSDNRLETALFTWNITVQNVNRAPQFLTELPNRSVNQTLTISNYLQSYQGSPVFYDPDDDLDGSGEIDGNETNSLVFTASAQSYLAISFDGPDVTLSPRQTGTVVVVYTATDAAGSQAVSNNVTYNVSYTPPTTTNTQTSSSGGGGGGGSSIVPMPITQDPEPHTIEIITPEPLTVYYNETIKAPIVIRNPSDRVMRGITLSAQTAAENVTFQFSRSQIEQLETDQEVNVSLYVSNYRGEGTYEIKVIADVDTPDVNDSAILYINSIEKGREGDSVQAKVTFAHDLVASNPECVELNELIAQAQRAIQTGQGAEADRLLNAVVDGCRYLVTQSNRREEVASGWDLSWLAQFRYANLVLGGMLVLLTGIAGMLVWHYRSAARAEKTED